MKGGTDMRKKLERMQMSGHYNVKKVYVLDEGGSFEVLPDEVMEDDECVVQIAATLRRNMEDEIEQEEEVALSKKEKQRLRKAEKEVFAGQVSVSEVYSEPRILAEAVRQGLEGGRGYDLKCGYDLRLEADIKKMWRELKEDKPSLTVVCPPCGPFSILQGLNYFKMEFNKVKSMVTEGLHHVRLAASVCKWQHKCGRWFLFEHPATSRAWQEEEMQELMQLAGVYVCRFDMCAYGMKIADGFNRKPTMAVTNSKKIALELQRKCPGGHQHEALMGGKAHHAESRHPRSSTRTTRLRWFERGGRSEGESRG